MKKMPKNLGLLEEQERVQSMTTLQLATRVFIFLVVLVVLVLAGPRIVDLVSHAAPTPTPVIVGK